MQKDGRQQVCIVRSTKLLCATHGTSKNIYIHNLFCNIGSIKAKEESSMYHAVLQLVIKKALEGNDTKQNGYS